MIALVIPQPTPVPRALLSALGDFSAPNVFNPWGSGDAMDDAPAYKGGYGARRERLLRHFDTKPLLLLIGEAPGFQGCHFSGVPFTNEKLILAGKIPRVSVASRITTRRLPFCEPSATVVWGELHKLGIADRVVMWNAFAWHPHKPDNPYSNRAPSRSELADGLPVLQGVLDHFAGVPIVPVGRVAENILTELGVSAQASLRHPARGGATLFRAGLRLFVEERNMLPKGYRSNDA
jgi:uracil-DNA glycosylase